VTTTITALRRSFKKRSTTIPVRNAPRAPSRTRLFSAFTT
jgi:hypothetical protein